MKRDLAPLLKEVFGSRVPLEWHWVSGPVYRIRRGAETFYLRVAEEAGEDLSTDAELYERLLDLGVTVARVVHVSPFDEAIGRSAMITRETPGAPGSSVSSVIEAAGADLAVINSVAVDGFGWVQRHGPGWPLRASHPTYPPFLTSYLPDPWPGPLASLFDLPALESLISFEQARPPAEARLAHGDFDLSQIFSADGRYTGLIDFGEIRGADPWFDLGHFLLHEEALLPTLLTGYQRVAPLPEDHLDAIRRSAILLGLRQLCRWLGPPRRYPLDHPLVTRRARRLNHLLGPSFRIP